MTNTLLSFGGEADNIYYKGHYLLTIQKVRKRDYVPLTELEEVRDWLESNGVIFHQYVIEAHGRYKQPHIHAHVYYPGRYKHLTKVGDGDKFPIFQVLWKRMHSYKGLRSYLHKFNRFEREQQLDEHYYRHNYGFK